MSQGWRVSGRWMWRLCSLVALSAATSVIVAVSADASTGPLSYGQADAWVFPPAGGGYVNDPASPGPTVRVNVPNAGGWKGYIEVWAQVRASRYPSAIGLFDVTGKTPALVPGQDTLCAQGANPPLKADLFVTLGGVPGTYGTPMNVGSGCDPVSGAPGPVLFRVAAGQRRFQLRYASCGCGGRSGVNHRKLWIRPVPSS